MARYRRLLGNIFESNPLSVDSLSIASESIPVGRRRRNDLQIMLGRSDRRLRSKLKLLLWRKGLLSASAWIARDREFDSRVIRNG